LRVARWAYLLEENPDFRRWYDNLARGSMGTAKNTAKVLYRFLRHHDMTPESLTDMAKRDVREVEDLLMDFVSELHGEGKAPGYIDNYLKAVKSWLKFNGVNLVRRIKVGNRNETPTIEDERVPTNEELLQILSYAGERGRCSISLIALAGLRPKTLGDMTGMDGLEVRDLPEMVIEGGTVQFTRIPTMVSVRKSLSKAKHKYFTFLGSEGCEYIKAYLEKRLAMGEELSQNSAIIAVKVGHEETGFRKESETTSKHIVTKTVTKEIREAMRPRFKWRPYVLRAYFDTRLLVAENHGKISHAYRQFFMGHVGDIEAKYTTNKGRLPDTLIEDMRRRFTDSEEYLTTRKASGEDPEMTTIRTMVESGVLDIHKPNVRAYLLQKLGIEDMEMKVARMRETGLEEDEAEATVIAGELGLDPMSLESLRSRRVKNTKKIVSEDELEGYLEEGWDIYSTLPSGSVVVRKVTYR